MSNLHILQVPLDYPRNMILLRLSQKGDFFEGFSLKNIFITICYYTILGQSF